MKWVVLVLLGILLAVAFCQLFSFPNPENKKKGGII